MPVSKKTLRYILTENEKSPELGTSDENLISKQKLKLKFDYPQPPFPLYTLCTEVHIGIVSNQVSK